MKKGLIMGTKRIIVEQIDENKNSMQYSNFDAFSDGFSQGFSLRSALVTACVTVLVILLLVMAI